MIGTREFTQHLGVESVISIPTKGPVFPVQLGIPHRASVLSTVSSHVWILSNFLGPSERC